MSQQNNDPMDFLRNMWGGKGFTLPGMITPTLDTEELNKRIKDLKTVEGWLRTNLSMLQMTIQNLEMQSTTLSAVKTMSQMYSEQAAGGGKTSKAAGAGGKPGAAQAAASPSAKAAGDAAGGLAQAAMWPWNLMQQVQEQMQHAADVASSKAPATKADAAPAGGARKTTERAHAAGGSATAAAAARARRKPGGENS